MSDMRTGQGGDGSKIRRLSDVVRKVRLADAERADSFADLHDADKARLEILSEELTGVFREVPEGEDFFLFQITSGSPPRLWIDPTAHILIGRDRRTYRFVKDTRLGRIVIAENADVGLMADVVTDYIAERVVERDRSRETDLLIAGLRSVAVPKTVAAEAAALKLADVPRQEGRGWSMLAAFLLGLAAGAILLAGYAWVKLPPV